MADFADRVRAVADESVPDYARVIRQVIDRAQLGFDAAAAERLLRSGDWGSVVNLSPWAQLLEPGTPGSLYQESYNAVLTTMSDAAGLVIEGRLDMTSPYVIRAAEQQAATLAHGVEDQTRQAIRDTISRAVAGKIDPREAAREIERVVGLDTRRAGALTRYHGMLLEDGRTPAQADRMADRYRARLVKQRATTIARNETLKAAATGTDLQWKDMARRGMLLGGTVRVWEVAGDERTCPICMGADGEEQPLGALFSTGVEYPPAHVLCRCTCALVTP